MTRLLEPYRVEETVTAVYVGHSVTVPGAWILRTDKGVLYLRDAPMVLRRMIDTHKAVAVKVRRFENTQFIETILSIQKAR